MAIQLKGPPVQQLPWLMAPETPPKQMTGRRIGGYTRGADGVYHLNGNGDGTAGIAQRVLLRYALGIENRAEIARRYDYSERFLQDVIGGRHFRWLTLPVRRRLLANGIGNVQMNREEKGVRPAQVKRALERLAALAADMLRSPEQWTDPAKEQVANDLFLISGAWREERS